MDLSTLYQWKQDMSIGVHVTTTKPFSVFKEDGEILKTFKEGLNGKIVSMKNENKKILSVYFEDCSYYEDLDPSNFTVRNDLSFSEAYNRLCESFGHYTNGLECSYQFNIKMHGYNVPESIEKDLGFDTMWDVIYEEQENLFNFFVGVDCDYSPLSFFSWIRDYYVAGKSGGYLILQDSTYPKESYDDALEHYEEDMEMNKDDEDYSSLYEAELIDYKKTIVKRAYDIELLEKVIRLTQESHFEYINSIEFWNEIIEIQNVV